MHNARSDSCNLLAIYIFYLLLMILLCKLDGFNTKYDRFYRVSEDCDITTRLTWFSTRVTWFDSFSRIFLGFDFIYRQRENNTRADLLARIVRIRNTIFFIYWHFCTLLVYRYRLCICFNRSWTVFSWKKKK